MDIGNRLINCLDDINVTQKEMALRLGIAPSTMNGYVKNIREPDAKTLVKLATELDISTDYLLGKTDIKKYPTQMSEAMLMLNEIAEVLSDENVKLLIERAHTLRDVNHQRNK